MDVMIHQQTEREAQWEQANREELGERIAQAVREDGTIQPIQGLHLSRSSLPLKPLHSVLAPSICVIAQGSKEVLLGDSRYQYDPSRYLLATVELPRVRPFGVFLTKRYAVPYTLVIWHIVSFAKGGDLRKLVRR